MNDEVKAIFAAHKNQAYPPELLKRASAEVEEFVNILQQEGVTVRRPDVIDQSQETVTPHFRTKGKICIKGLNHFHRSTSNKMM